MQVVVGPGPMTDKKTLLNRVESLYRLTSRRTSAFAVALCLAGSSIAIPSAWASEPESDPAAMAFNQLTVLESLQQQPEAASEIDLESVQDMESMVDEARMRAQVAYLAEKLRKPPQAVQKYVQLAWAEAGRRVGLTPELLIAIMHKESTFRPKVQNRYGAQGLMQVVRRWHREKLKASESLFDPAVNVRVGADILEEYLESVGGDLSKALAKYSGNSRGYANKVLGESRKLAHVADMAAAEVAMATWQLDDPSAGQTG